MLGCAFRLNVSHNDAMTLRRRTFIYIVCCRVSLFLRMLSVIVMGQHNAQLGPERGRAPPKWDSLL